MELVPDRRAGAKKDTDLTLDVPGGGPPEWSDVTPAQLGSLPWMSICEVRVKSGSQFFAQGTAWLAGRRTLLTAAHVVRLCDGDLTCPVRLRFPSRPEAVAVMQIEPHPLARAHLDDSGDLDPFDVCALRVAEDSGVPLAMSPPIQDIGTVEVAGFPFELAGGFVTHVAGMIRPDAQLLLHQVHTRSGHSGAPLLLRNGSAWGLAIGIHVHGTDRNPYKVTLPGHNVAIALVDDVLDFARAWVQAWG
jgi:hypothetical protein